MYKRLLSLGGIVIGFTANAQETTSKTFLDDPINHPDFMFYVIVTLLLVVFFLVLAVAIVFFRTLNMMIEQSARDKARATDTVYVPKPNFWSRFSRTVNASVPIEKEGEIDMGHDFDGIRELDNHLPPWWKWLFWATIGWSAVYLVVFHVTSALPLSGQEYENQVAEAEIQKQKILASQPQANIDLNKLDYNADAAIIAKGEKIFTSINCGSCHRNDGGGNSIGPNLTDTYWLHGGDIKSIFETVNKGVVEKGMPAWGKTLSPGEVRDVTFFVMSLQGTNPANPKSPQGELYKTREVQNDSLTVQAVGL